MGVMEGSVCDGTWVVRVMTRGGTARISGIGR